VIKRAGLLQLLSSVDKDKRDFIEIEYYRRLFLYYLFGLLACVFMLLFGSVSLVQGRYLLAAFLLFLFAVTALNILHLKKSQNINLASWIDAMVISLLSVYLITTGGVDNTGPLWVYPLLPFMLFIQGHRLGFVTAFSLLTLIAFILFRPLDFLSLPDYSMEFKIRYIASLGSVLLFSWATEYLRHAAYVQLRAQGEKLETASRTDFLTGLANRRYALERLHIENTRFQRNQRSYSVLLIDIDDFKHINDNLGHGVGDCMLKQVAQSFLDQVREQDLVSRWGGEEFMIMLPDTSLDQGHLTAEKLRHHIEQARFECDGQSLAITISIGVEASQPGQNPMYFIDLADEKLYRAKASGKNQVVSILD
jgi:diguanylate cyclase (GGDEF)-like protein